MRKTVLFILMLCIAFTGCQKTPEKSAVASKADGLSADVIAKPLGNGETRLLDVPEHWKVEEKKSNDRVTILADLELGKMEVGNLPVIEMKNHEFSQNELEKLVSYFSEGEELYLPEIYTKQVYQSVLDRIAKKEGSYDNQFMWTVYKELEGALKKAVELAPETVQEPEKVEIKFQKQIDNPALRAAKNWGGRNVVSHDTDVYFNADVGAGRTAHIEAECYDSSIENSSRFDWQKGASIVGADDMHNLITSAEYRSTAGLDVSGYIEQFVNLLKQYEVCLEQNEIIDEKDGQVQAEQVLEDLDIGNMELLSSEKILWFPTGAYPEQDYPGFGEDFMWQGDLEQAEAGYQYIFSPFVGGIPAREQYGTIAENTTASYIPPFPVEMVIITVTKDGVKSFSWEGMTEEVKRIADNTQLLPFDIIQNQLLDQIFYLYSQMGQPANDPTLINYRVADAHLEYTYVPAYGEPQNAWLVPAWIFAVTEATDGLERPSYDKLVLNALDGGVIGRVD